jgi:CheY-like chemotaxis protein
MQEQVFGTINNRQLKALQTVERSSNHLLELINDILDVAKIESGQIELDYSPTAIAPLCQSSLAFIKQQALKKRIQLEIKLQPHLPDLFVDERRIRQVLINLLNNALKFTPEGGKITLEVSQTAAGSEELAESKFLRIAVMDTGIGISAENIKKLFQPFIQIDSALNRQYTGTGLGLALVKRIVELHGGNVELTSEVGIGSCFAIELPFTLDPSPILEINHTPAPRSEQESLPQKTSLILLAEDNEANVSTFSSYLSAKGYRLIMAKDGEEAIALAKAHTPDIILMDIQMPKLDGLEATKQIRLDPNLVNIPIIAITALAMTGDRERCLEAGANDYLAKPIKLKQLDMTIRQFLVDFERRV